MKKLFYIFVILSLSGSLLGCSKLVEGLNDNPNQPSSTSPDLLLTGLQLGAVSLHSGELSRDAGLLSGYFVGTERQYLSFYNYMIINADFSTHWANSYRVIRNAVVMDQLAAEENREGILVGIGKVMSAHTFGTITALWGDVPFKEAGQYAEYKNPSYENQIQVYDQIQVMLDDAITSLESPVGRPVANADLFFDGNPTRWIKVAHALKARFYLHVGNYAKAYEHALLGIRTPSESWQADFFQNELNAQNLYEQFYRGNRAGDLQTNGSYFFELLSPTGSEYRGDAKTNETARFSYLVNTTGGRSINNTTANGAFGATAPYALLSYEENLLTLAEAAYHVEGFSGALAYLNELRAYYSTGEHLSPAYQGVPYQYDPYVASDFALGGMAAVAGLNQEQSLLNKILEEKYIVLYSHVEGFNLLRRTLDEPYGLSVPPNTGTRIPQRFIYPQTELDRNINKPDYIPNLFEKTPVNQ